MGSATLLWVEARIGSAEQYPWPSAGALSVKVGSLVPVCKQRDGQYCEIEVGCDELGNENCSANVVKRDDIGFVTVGDPS